MLKKENVYEIRKYVQVLLHHDWILQVLTEFVCISAAPHTFEIKQARTHPN